jgi:hypothetical protein
MPRGPTTKAAEPGGLQKGNLTHQQRLAIVRKKDEEPRWTQEDLARWAKKQFGLLRQPTQSTISNILKARERLETMTTSLNAKSVRPVKHPELDAALLLWLRDRQNYLQLATIGDLVRDKARHMAHVFQYRDEMSYSNGWMRSFLTRHGVEFRRNQVDARERQSLESVRALVAAYPPQDVFTFATTNLWYRLEPKKDGHANRRAAAVTATTTDEGETLPPAEEPALVVGLGANMDGSERWPPVIVSRVKQPPSFQQKSAFQWHFLDYFVNGRAQMTSTIFEIWLKRLNQRMALSHRRVLLVVDSAPSHVQLTLSHVRVVVGNDESELAEPHGLRALGAAVALAFKCYYRKRQLASAVDRAEAGEPQRFAVSQLKAMRWIEQAWKEVPAPLLVDAWALLNGPAPDKDVDASLHHKHEIHATLTHFLEQLDVPGRVKSQDVALPRGEDDAPHYIYDDATIVPLVLGAMATHVDDEWAGDVVDAAELELPADATGAASHLHRALLTKLEQLRGVIQTIDEETPPSDEVATVLAFLRRRQATLRAELQRVARESGFHAPSSATTTTATTEAMLL